MSDTPAPKREKYYSYNQFPLKLVPTPEGGQFAWRLKAGTGGWEPANDVVDELFNSRAETHPIDREGFVELTEAHRALYLRGDGPLFALYETVNAIVEQAKAENYRRLTEHEVAMVRGLRRKTYAMFERQLAEEGHPGADPEPER